MWKWDNSKTDFIPKNNLFKDITGERFGRLVTQYPIRKGKTIRWVCLCDCGNESNVETSDLRTGQTASCGCLKKEQTVEQNKLRSKYIGDIPGYILGYIKIQAKIRNIQYDLDGEYLWNLFISQNKKCALSDVDIKFGKKYIGEDVTASLDRIDSSKGYIEGNVQWVHKDINYMKNDFDENYFVLMCKLVSNKKGELNNEKTCANGNNVSISNL